MTLCILTKASWPVCPRVTMEGPMSDANMAKYLDGSSHSKVLGEAARSMRAAHAETDKGLA